MKPDEQVQHQTEGDASPRPERKPDQTAPHGAAPGREAEGIADALLAVAMAVENHDRRMKECIRRAAAAGNLALVQELLALWTEGDPDKGRKENAA